MKDLQIKGLCPVNSRAEAQPQQRAPQNPIKAELKVGRNDACPCGSGKKFKNCHGKES